MFLLYLGLVPAFAWSQADTNQAVYFDIPQQRADEALIQFAEQASLTFIVPFDQLEGLTANELIGSFSPEDALNILLSGTPLQAEISGQRLSINTNVSSGGESDMNNKARVGIFGAVMGFLGLGDTVFAQPQGEAASTSRYAIEEVVITARKIEEGLQDAPIAVTALSGLELENRGALDVVDFADVAPNVSLKTNGVTSGFAAAPRTSIRGVGQSDFVINTDPAVGMYADGVYLGRSIGSVLDLVDVERVEALRGPQGTLFGRNSTGGAINIISKKPEVGGSAFGYFSAGIGEEGYMLLRGSANVPLGDEAALRFSVLKRERDGHIPVIHYDNLDLGAEDVTGLRAAFRYQPSDSFTLDLDVDVSERDDTAAPIIAVDLGDLSEGEDPSTLSRSGAGGQSAGISTAVHARRFNGEPFGPPIGNAAPFAAAAQPGFEAGTDCSDPAIRDSSFSCLGDAWNSTRDGTWQSWFDSEGNLTRPDQELETYGYSARMTWDLENITIKTISSWRGFDSSFTNGSPAPIYVATNNNVKFDQDQSSHEINLSGDFNDGGIRWLLGAFYQEEDGVEIVEVRYPLAPPGSNTIAEDLPTINVEERNIDNTSEALYGQLSFDLSDAVEFTLGARRTEEVKDVLIRVTNSNINVDPVNQLTNVEEGSKDISESSFLANLSWNFSDDSMTYFQFSDGFRNGGFPARIPAGTTLTFDESDYDQEFVESYEWGMKSTLLDGALRANLAVFRSDYTDMQINATIFDPGAGTNISTIQNIGDSVIQGIELEANYLVNDNFRLDASLGYLDTDLENINTADGTFTLNTGTNLQKTITEDSNIELPHAPELQVNIGANYSFYLGNGAEIRNRIDLFYEADQYASIGNYNSDLVPSTTRVNYVLTYFPQDANWELGIGARNLTDEDYIVNSTASPSPRAGLYQVFARGREAYLQFKYSFGD